MAQAQQRSVLLDTDSQDRYEQATMQLSDFIRFGQEYRLDATATTIERIGSHIYQELYAWDSDVLAVYENGHGAYVHDRAYSTMEHEYIEQGNELPQHSLAPTVLTGSGLQTALSVIFGYPWRRYSEETEEYSSWLLFL